MKVRATISIALTSTLLVIGQSALAMTIANENPSTGPAPKVKPDAAATGAVQTGAIAAVDADGRVQINGQWFRVSAGTTHVFRQGREVSSDTLAKGTAVRYTMTADKATLAIVFLQ